MDIIKTDHLVYEYVRHGDDGEVEQLVRAINDVSLTIEEGSFVAILGRNGSGKSTFAKQLNALLGPTDGTVWVSGHQTDDEEHLWDIRQDAGMVFQNPDNQIVATMVEEDVAFGPENIGVPTEDIWKRVDEALQAVGMTAHRLTSPNRLSGGQKQRTAISGIMAMRPRCIIMDEPTAMLDPVGRREVLSTIHELNQKEKITVLLITHYMEETLDADRVIIMQKGRVALDGSPREIFAEPERIRTLGLSLPPVLEVNLRLKKAGLPLQEGLLTVPELQEAVLREAAQRKRLQTPGSLPECAPAAEKKDDRTPALVLEHISYTYEPGTPMETQGLKDVSLNIYRGELLAIIGQTGSGKSTIIQHMNGLVRPGSGRVLFDGEDIFAEKYNRRVLRGRVGLVFQYPEYQLFESDVLSDICFGPRNQGLSPDDAALRAKEAMAQVGLDESYEARSPFELSGGEKRRVAIAGVLAMKPDIMILDEPTAGLDPQGREELLEILMKLRRESGLGIVLVSHSMDDVMRVADRIAVMHEGRLLGVGEPRRIFLHQEEMEAIGLSLPDVTKLLVGLRHAGLPVATDAVNPEEAANMIAEAFN